MTRTLSESRQLKVNRSVNGDNEDYGVVLLDGSGRLLLEVAIGSRVFSRPTMGFSKLLPTLAYGLVSLTDK
ncbi:hypothetical protein QFZ77_003001 [Paenibacillus sp. V4I3]|uniref:hypothetical protein n=1 Tax=Paenibacillus sp. V4I3 TaxID=3042305 RepID=UPI002789F6EA|nr:hypothetical protein [Paenibacillus sp. V4I3]MDQ0874342.1 hypothetical protein [Paenibacillus sp. V4I3]